MEATPKVIENFGVSFSVPIFISCGVSVLLFALFTILSARKVSMKPGKLQNALEALMEFTKTALRIYMGAMFLFGIQVSFHLLMLDFVRPMALATLVVPFIAIWLCSHDSIFLAWCLFRAVEFSICNTSSGVVWNG